MLNLDCTATLRPLVRMGRTFIPKHGTGNSHIKDMCLSESNFTICPKRAVRQRNYTFISLPSVFSLLTPPKGLAALSALRDGSWKDGCY